MSTPLLKALTEALPERGCDKDWAEYEWSAWLAAHISALRLAYPGNKGLRSVVMDLRGDEPRKPLRLPAGRSKAA